MKIDLSDDIQKFEGVERDDGPDQTREAEVAMAITLAAKAVDFIADTLTSSVEEQDEVVFSVAMSILERYKSRLIGKVLAKRIGERQQ